MSKATTAQNRSEIQVVLPPGICEVCWHEGADPVPNSTGDQAYLHRAFYATDCRLWWVCEDHWRDALNAGWDSHPKEERSKRDARVVCYLTPTKVQQLQAIADLEGQSLSELLRGVIHDYISHVREANERL